MQQSEIDQHSADLLRWLHTAPTGGQQQPAVVTYAERHGLDQSVCWTLLDYLDVRGLVQTDPAAPVSSVVLSPAGLAVARWADAS